MDLENTNLKLEADFVVYEWFADFNYRDKHYIFKVDAKDIDEFWKYKDGDRVVFTDESNFSHIFNVEEIKNLAFLKKERA